MISNLSKSIQLHAKGFQWLIMKLAKGKYWWFFIPGLALSLLFNEAIDWSKSLQEQSMDVDWFGLGKQINSAVESSSKALSWFFLQIEIFFLLTFLSPLFTYLSERVDEDLTGKNFPFDLFTFVTEFFRMLGIVTVSLFLEGIFLILYSIFSWIFGLDFLDPVVYFCLAAYFYGFSFYDYCFERYQIGIFSSLRFARQKAMLTFVTGVCFTAITYVPTIGYALAPVFATVLATYVFLGVNEKIIND